MVVLHLSKHFYICIIYNFFVKIEKIYRRTMKTNQDQLYMPIYQRKSIKLQELFLCIPVSQNG